jgi:hypothetical protein
MMRTLRQGWFAGLLAGLIAAFLFVVDAGPIDAGPGNSLHGLARWFHLDTPEAGKWVGFLLMLLMGGVFGLLFEIGTRRWQPELGRWLLAGLVAGIACWALFGLVIGTGINHVPLTLGGLLVYGIPLLVYGVLLGSISFQWKARQSRHNRQSA